MHAPALLTCHQSRTSLDDARSQPSRRSMSSSKSFQTLLDILSREPCWRRYAPDHRIHAGRVLPVRFNRIDGALEQISLIHGLNENMLCVFDAATGGVMNAMRRGGWWRFVSDCGRSAHPTALQVTRSPIIRGSNGRFIDAVVGGCQA